MSIDSTFTGFFLRDGRRGGFCWDEKPRCVNVFGGEPHRLKTKGPVIADLITRCEHRPASKQGECGARLYVALLTFGGSAKAQGRGERLWLVVEVTAPQIQRISTEPMILLEKLSLLNCVLPGVASDVLGGVDEIAAGGLGT